MKLNKNFSRILGFIVLMSMLLLFGGLASAQEATTQGNRTEILQTTLEQLVKEGVFSQDKAQEVKAYFAKKHDEWKKIHEEMKKLSPEERKALKDKWHSEKRKPGGRLTEQLVKDNILSQKQADLLKAKLKENRLKQKQQQIETGLKALVDKGVLTQEQSDKVIKQLQQAKSERQALFQKAKNMSSAERQKFLKENKANLKNPLDQLIKEGVLNEEQAKAVKQVLPHCKSHCLVKNVV